MTLGAVKLVYRPMRSEPDGKPALGRTLSTLGVRPDKDIAVDPVGCVEPETGGMSVTPDRWEDVPPPLLPRALGGEGRHPLYYLEIGRLPPTLRGRVDRPKHANIEPVARCLFEAFEVDVHGTRTQWEMHP